MQQRLVTAEGALTAHGAITVSLSELVELDAKDGRLVPRTDLGVLVGVPERKAGAAPNRFGPLITGLIEARINNRQSLPGRNEEAKAVLKAFEHEHPDLNLPSLSSVKSYLSKIRSGQ